MLLELEQRYRRLSDEFQARLGERDGILQQRAACLTRISVIEREIVGIEKTSLFLQSFSDEVRRQVLDKISAIVSDAVQKIKDPKLSFKMTMTMERNQSDLKFFLVDTVTGQEYDILTSFGGGIADIVSFALRVCLLLKWPQELSRVLILDEQLKFVGVSDQDALGDFIRQLAEELNLQIIFVTHAEDLSKKAHRTFMVRKVDGISTVTITDTYERME